MITIGHRGCAGVEPENTFRGFKAAIDLGVSAVELDIRATKDKQLVVIHDAFLDRTTNIKGKVSDYTYKELLKADAGKKEKVPLLIEVLELVRPSNVIVHVELKEPGLVELMLKEIRELKMLERVCVISFWHKELVKVKKIEPSVKTGILTVSNPVNVKSLVRDTMVEFVSIALGMADRMLVEDVHKCNGFITVWGGIDSVEKIDQAVNLGVDGIATDFPGLLIKRLNEISKIYK
ncbi:MAG: hypothetical protein A2231_11855 [Candidatus Firestonebacteria bacterium RIFOXYA2_FULL_40_8]|nr:MAG: hypothetical protein A2231_11855 [Candidatus Firestonebacteria bacterium RIFOXYA2_FULL_40_8]